MRPFELLFDSGEPSAIEHPGYAPYGKLGFPPPPPGRPWIFSNFVQSLDGIVSLRGHHGAGSDIAQSEEDRWLMDLLRAHADAVLTGFRTLLEEKVLGERPRGPVFRIMEPELLDLRQKLGRGREVNIIVSGAASLELSDYRLFDGELVDPVLLTTAAGAARLRGRDAHPQLRIMVAGDGPQVDLGLAVRQLREQLGIEHLLCEGGPSLYGNMSRGGLIDEKFVTISPVEVGQFAPLEQERLSFEPATGPLPRPTIFNAIGFTKEQMPWWRWLSCRRVGEHAFNRYRRVRGQA